MSGSPTTGLNGQIWADLSTAGTMAASGTANLKLLSAKNSWTVAGARDYQDVSGFGDTVHVKVPTLTGASGDIKGQMDMAGTGTLIHLLTNATTERALIIIPDVSNYPGIFYGGKCFADFSADGAISSAVNLNLHFESGPSGMSWTGI